MCRATASCIPNSLSSHRTLRALRRKRHNRFVSVTDAMPSWSRRRRVARSRGQHHGRHRRLPGRTRAPCSTGKPRCATPCRCSMLLQRSSASGSMASASRPLCEWLTLGATRRDYMGLSSPITKIQQKAPTAAIALMNTSALTNEPLACTSAPITIGTTIAERFAEALNRPPTRPSCRLGDISDSTAHPKRTLPD